MLSLYRASVDYMIAEQRCLGLRHAGLVQSQSARMQHFCDSLRSIPPDVGDSSATLQALSEQTPAFTEEQRAELSQAASTHMRQSLPSPTAGTKSQSNLYIHKYMTDTAWKVAMSKEYSWESKLEYFGDYLLGLGLPNPNDETVKLMIAIMALSTQREMTPDDAYAQIHSLKTKIVNKRLLKKVPQSMSVFPEDPADFMRVCPTVFQEYDQPVASRIEEGLLRQQTRRDLMPCRSNNRAKKGSAATANVATTPSNPLEQLALQFLMGQAGMGTAQPPQLQFTNHGRQAHRGAIPLSSSASSSSGLHSSSASDPSGLQLALPSALEPPECGGTALTAAPALPPTSNQIVVHGASSSSDASGGILATIAQAKSVMSKNKILGAKRLREKTPSHKVEIAESAESQESDDEDDEETKPLMKKPMLMKKPVAEIEVKKKPAAGAPADKAIGEPHPLFSDPAVIEKFFSVAATKGASRNAFGSRAYSYFKTCTGDNELAKYAYRKATSLYE